MSIIMSGGSIFTAIAFFAASLFNEAVNDNPSDGFTSQSAKPGSEIGTGLGGAYRFWQSLPGTGHIIPVSAQGKLAPDAIQETEITVTLTHVGTIESAVRAGKRKRTNLGSPVTIDGELFVADQQGGVVFRFDEQASGGKATEVFSVAQHPPDDLTFKDKVSILNIADGPGNVVYMALTAQTLPSGVVPNHLPDDDRYLFKRMNYQVIYKYDENPFDGIQGEPDPVLLAAFEQVPGHRGGGLLTLPNGDLLFARGDNLGFNRDGLGYPQDENYTVSKLLIIDQDTGAITLAAKGVRNAQHLTYTDASKRNIAFVDIGAAVADELNVISTNGLLDVSEIENFGWGRIANDASDGDGTDGTAREGTFYINGGHTEIPKTVPVALGKAPVGEAGFLQPYAEAGGEGASLFAFSGPVYSDRHFTNIEALFGDLVSGDLYATLRSDTASPKSVFRLNLVSPSGTPIDLLEEAMQIDQDRVDVRFFSFPDGQPGLLTEQTGAIYRLVERTN